MPRKHTGMVILITGRLYAPLLLKYIEYSLTASGR